MGARKLTCFECGQMNRVDEARFVEGPKCGTCGAALFPAKPVAIDAAILAKASRNDEVPLVVDFWAPWCGPCRQMAPEFEKAATSLRYQARLVKLDTQAHQSASARWNIRSIPTLALFKNGREANRTSGARPASAIIGFARQTAGK